MSSITIETSKCTDEENNVIINIVEAAFNNNENNADRAKCIKRAIDEHFDGHWQCIVGRNFATFVTHEENKFCHLSAGNQTAVQIFKAGY